MVYGVIRYHFTLLYQGLEYYGVPSTISLYLLNLESHIILSNH